MQKEAEWSAAPQATERGPLPGAAEVRDGVFPAFGKKHSPAHTLCSSNTEREHTLLGATQCVATCHSSCRKQVLTSSFDFNTDVMLQRLRPSLQLQPTHS